MAIDWQDQGIVLDVRAFGERDALLHLFTSGYGRHAGLVRFAVSRSNRPLLQPGNLLACRWQARLANQLGSWRIEPLKLSAGLLIGQEQPLTALIAATTLVMAATGEREPMPMIFAGLSKLIEMLIASSDWLETYLRFEMLILAQSGFALDLSKCAVTSQTHDLTLVSPRTGRAVSSEAGAAYADRLLPLPGFLRGDPIFNDRDALACFRLTGHFLRRHLFAPVDQDLPLARERLVAWVARRARGLPT